MTNILGEKHIFLTHTSIHEVLIFLCTCFWAGSLTLELGFVTARQHGGFAGWLLVGCFCSLQCGSSIQKKESEGGDGPVQLSKFLGRDKEKEEGAQRSAISGKKIMMKLEKTKEDKAAESKRNELLKFLNASYD